MTKKFDEFVLELKALLVKHDVTICPSMYDSLQVHDMGRYDKPEDLDYALEDCTKDTGEV